MISRVWLVYAGLLLLRLCFAVSKSYIHPDEMFQGSEIVVGDIFNWPTIRTWEFAGSRPIRSIVPIYLFQSPLLYHLRMFTTTDSSTFLFYTLRVQQYLWTLLLDGLIFAITRSQTGLLLYASSYTTLVYHTHTFSNSWETILVLATLLVSHGEASSLLMGPLSCLGLFTRITFPAFMAPLAVVRLRKTISWDNTKKSWQPVEEQIQLNAFSVLVFTALALVLVYLDTVYYTGQWLGVYSWQHAVYTAWNSIVYNTSHDNLSQHGIHPRFTHLLNMVVLLGPGILLVTRVKRNVYSASLLSGLLALSIAPHQEARFLLPCVALFFASLRIGHLSKKFWTIWLIFNLAMASMMGVLHQCGVIPAALHISRALPNASVTWTKSYPAPKLLLGPDVQIEHLYGSTKFDGETDLFVAPVSSAMQPAGYELIYRDAWHVNLDDGLQGGQVFWQRGIAIYRKMAEVVPDE